MNDEALLKRIEAIDALLSNAISILERSDWDLRNSRLHYRNGERSPVYEVFTTAASQLAEIRYELDCERADWFCE